MTKKPILAFIHIEKAAGQTFIRILENNFIYKHCRVAPLKKEHHGVFQWADLKILLRVNPFLEALAGHSVMPFSDLAGYVPNIRYITILRDPVKRYISHYQYWVQVLNRQISFKEFLSLEDMKDFQTKKLAGSADLHSAKRNIKNTIFLAGILEEFDDFLIVLKRKMAPEPFDIAYRRRNVAKSNSVKNQISDSFHEYENQISENNQMDIELYDFVKKDIFRSEKKQWIGEYPTVELEGSNRLLLKIHRALLGRVYRRFYIGPIMNIIRYKNGLKVGGSY